MRRYSQKEFIRLIEEVRALLPDFLSTLGHVERLSPPPHLMEQVHSLRVRIGVLLDEARRLSEEDDCMPAAEAGRKKNSSLL